MSVTFSPEVTGATDDRLYELICDATGADETIYATTDYYDAGMEARLHGLTCEGCATYGVEVWEVNAEPSVNVSNSNALDLLDLLGYPIDLKTPDLSGVANAADFLARVTLARGMEPDGSLPEVVMAVDNGSRWIKSGRAPGYLMDRLADLWEVGQYAATHDRRITWG